MADGRASDEVKSHARASYRFARVPEWILLHQDLDPLAVRVYGVLDRFDGRDCIPSLKRIGERLGRSADSVRRAIRQLEAVRAVVIEERFTDGRQTSNRYYLAGDQQLPPMPSRPGTDATLPPGNHAGDGGGTDATRSKATGSRATGTNENAHPAGEPDRFDEFWAMYPRRQSKKAARAKWDAAVKTVDAQTILDALARHVDHWERAGTARKFIPHPDTWLNQGRWEDTLDPLPDVGSLAARSDADAREAARRHVEAGNLAAAWQVVREHAAANGATWFVEVDDLIAEGRDDETIKLLSSSYVRPVTDDDVAYVRAMRAVLEDGATPELPHSEP